MTDRAPRPSLSTFEVTLTIGGETQVITGFRRCTSTFEPKTECNLPHESASDF